jgi:hypothetical protein
VNISEFAVGEAEAVHEMSSRSAGSSCVFPVAPELLLIAGIGHNGSERQAEVQFGSNKVDADLNVFRSRGI